jgi:hypothetical protein
MKAKKKAGRSSTKKHGKTPDKRRIAKEALKLTAKAKAEVVRLLEANRAGMIPQAELEMKLCEVKEELAGSMRFVKASL